MDYWKFYQVLKENDKHFKFILHEKQTIVNQKTLRKMKKTRGLILPEIKNYWISRQLSHWDVVLTQIYRIE